MFPTFNETAAQPGLDKSQPVAAALQSASPTSDLAIRTTRLKQTLTGGAKLRAEDNALHQPGPHARPGADIDAGMQTIQLLARAIALDPEAAQSADAAAVVAQAQALKPVITDIQTFEANADIGGLDAPASVSMVHESGILNLTVDHHMPVPDNLLAGEKIIEHLGHALGHADGTIARKPNPAAARLRDAIGEPRPDEEEELEDVLTPHEAVPDAPVLE